MAINVNNVYKSVLSILNKEQRGYLTADEFNRMAKQAQLTLLDQAFAIYNKEIRLEEAGAVSEGYANLPDKTREKIDAFYKESSITVDNTTGEGTLPTDVYKIIDISKNNTVIERVDKNKLSYLKSSKLTQPTTNFPVYHKTSSAIVVDPISIATPTLRYIKVPNTPRWGYSTNATYGTSIYDSNPYVDGGAVLGNRTIGIVSTNATDLTNGSITINLQNSTTGVTSTSSGTGMNVTIAASGSTVTSVKINAAGSGYTIGDEFTLANAAGSIINSTNVVITLRAEDLYASTTQGSTDFELHPSEETMLILTILGYAGVTIKDPAITQLTTQISQANEAVKQ
tara:strand:+ start:3939 stop:4961 length:1023 start_codon:yes stop_codon:yes gene_type:complete